jgi:hypothetical protein
MFIALVFREKNQHARFLICWELKSVIDDHQSELCKTSGFKGIKLENIPGASPSRQLTSGA